MAQNDQRPDADRQANQIAGRNDDGQDAGGNGQPVGLQPLHLQRGENHQAAEDEEGQDDGSDHCREIGVNDASEQYSLPFDFADRRCVSGSYVEDNENQRNRHDPIEDARDQQPDGRAANFLPRLLDGGFLFRRNCQFRSLWPLFDGDGMRRSAKA